MRDRRPRMLAACLVIGVGLFATFTPAPAFDDNPDPFPCETICVPSPVFPFVICNPSSPPPPPPGPGF